MPKNEIIDRAQIYTRLANLIESGFRYGCIAYCVRQAYLAIDTLAGRTTNADIALFVKYVAGGETGSFLGKALPWILVVSVTLWALVERVLRKRQIERFETHVRNLELRLDPGRSSSRLTRRGDTNPEDR